MKIGFVYDMVYPYSRGGAEKRFYHLASLLARRHEVHVVGLKLWDGPSTIVSESGVILHGVQRYPGQMYIEQGRRSLWQPVWFGAALWQWPGLRTMDVIDCSSFPYFSIFSARALAQLGKTPLVTTWHEFWGDYWQEYAPRVAPLGKAIEKLSLRTSERAITVSEYTRSKMVAAGYSADRITVIPNGIELDRMDSAAPVPGGPDVLFVGRLIQEKRVAELLRALATGPLRDRQATCWVIGSGVDGERLRSLARDLQLGERVRFHEGVSDDFVYGAMKSAGVVALLSEREGFGMVVLEAMACGAPVVVSPGRNSAAPDLVRPGETGAVVPCDPDALSNAIADIIWSPERRAIMSRRARAEALGYTWDRIAQQAEQVYLAAIGNGHYGDTSWKDVRSGSHV